MAQLTQWLWRQEYWLPPGITWADMQETEDVRYPQPQHLLLGLPITLLLLVLRFFFKRNISVPLSKKLGLREKLRQKPSPNPILEAFYTKRRRSPQKEEVTSLAQQCDLQPRQVERWLRSRRNQDRPSLTKKFCEASWRATYCITSFCMGLAILHDKPWFWDDRECWVGYPQQPLQPSISGYYLTQFSFCCSLVILLPFDVKRMAAKMFHYLKWQKTCDALFVTFSAVFLFTRLVIFPYKILYNTYYYSMELCQPFFGYYFFNTLLMVLQLLHVFWSCLIIRMVYRFLIHGTAEKDVRSDSEGSEDDEDEADRKAE
ncbi:ceramide synthase 4 isoform X2 [Candoia aspera]|uniref:ceramide synthase 4 isoform X2 n=1 Tax=Candoia aspera TaxID=51853 RepID=UPI002FD87A7B